MSRSSPTLPPEVRALLDSERSIPPVSTSERARAMTRARAALVAGVTRSSAPDPARPTRWSRWAAVAAVACVASAAIGASAYEIRAHLVPSSARRSIDAAMVAPQADPWPTLAPSVAATPSPLARSAETTATTETADSIPTPGGSMGTPTLTDADSARTELRLLRQARAAVAREDYPAALHPIAEHTRRFKNGRLVEEREALRVKALAGLGRIEDARRAAAIFQARFPHSVLLRSVTQMPNSGR